MVALLAAILIMPALAPAQGTSWRSASDEQAAGRDNRYRQGQAALDQNRFDDAAEQFRAVADKNGTDGDAARYWQAWAEWKGGNAAGARRSLERLRKDHAESPWLDDARALESEIRAGRGGSRGGHQHHDSAENSNEALKLVALNSLMNSDAPEAIDAVARLLDRTDDGKTRERALFVLGQSSNPKAAEILADIARGNRAPDLQRDAVRLLGMSDNQANLRLLESIYQKSADREIKSAVLHAYFLADQETSLLTLARNEKDPELQQQAIHKLGLVQATKGLAQLYQETSDIETKARILHALFLAEDEAFLVQAARTEREPKLRNTAIHSLGLIEANEALRSLYSDANDADARAKIMHALFLADDEAFFSEVLKNEQDPELRSQAIHNLGLLGAINKLHDLYATQPDLETRKQIMNALFLSNDGEGLVKLAKNTQNQQEREAIVHWLSLMNDDEHALAYMLEILER